MSGASLSTYKRTQLNRALSKLGLCSRTTANGWILAGRIKVNGKIAASPEQWVELGKDEITVEGLAPNAVPKRRAHVYLCVNKPAGFVTTRSDELGRKTVYDLLPPHLSSDWIFPVGRLDKDSEGLLLMTDDGEWADRLTDPLFHVEKTYRVKLDRKPKEEDLRAFRAGLDLAGKRTLPAQVIAENGMWVRAILREGRNRQIRRMFHDLGYKIKRLIRIAVGPLLLGDLKPGGSKILESDQVDALSLAPKTRPIDRL